MRNKERVKRKVAVCIFAAAVVCSTFPSRATTIEETKEKAESLEREKQQTKQQQEQLQSQISDLSAKMDQTVRDIAQKKADIKQAEDDLVTAKVDENSQYESMKKRIRYMYENGQISVMQIFAESRDFGEMLNKIEYVQKISEYDRNKLEEFTQVRLDVEAREKKLNEEYEALGALQEEMKGQRVQLEETLAAANMKVADLDEKIVANAAELQRLIREAEEAERIRKEKEEADAAARRAAEAAAAQRAAQEQASSSSSSESYSYSAPSVPSYTPAPSAPVVSGNAVFTHPCPGMTYQSSYFGEIREFEYGGHKGNDYAAPTGTPTYAAAAGKVIIANYSSSAGNWVVIDHGNGLTTKYMHHSALAVSAGQYVEKGQQIGYVGTTGQSTGPHLHFQVEVNGVPVHPDSYLY